MEILHRLQLFTQGNEVNKFSIFMIGIPVYNCNEGGFDANLSQIGRLLMEMEILETQWNGVQFDILVTSFTFTYI